jgi:hypothetical protein
MNAYDCLTYTFLAILLLYIVNKIRQNMGENFAEYQVDNSTHSDMPNNETHMLHHKMGIAHTGMGPRHQQMHKEGTAHMGHHGHKGHHEGHHMKHHGGHHMKHHGGHHMKHHEGHHMKHHEGHHMKHHEGHHMKHHRKNISKYHDFDNSHHYSEEDFKLGKNNIMGLLETDESVSEYTPDEGESLNKLTTQLMEFESKKHKHHGKEHFDGNLGDNIENFDDNISHMKTKKCVIDETEFDADTFIRKKLLAGSNYKSGTNYSNNDLKKYRDNHFAFRNNVWQTSKDVDMVDKINDMYFSGDQDLTRNRKGTRIADLFDDLTRNEDKIAQSCVSNMTSEKGIDRLMNQEATLVKGHNGSLISDDLWFYNKEKTMNGGDFFDGIKPHEGPCSINQAL